MSEVGVAAGLVAMGSALLALVTTTGGPQPAARPVVDVVRLAEDPTHVGHGDWTPWREPGSGLPFRLTDPRLTFSIDPAVTETVGADLVADGLSAFNGVAGSGVHVTVHAAPDAAARWRVELDPCHGRPVDERAHVVVDVVDRDRGGAWVGAGTIRLCPSALDLSAPHVRALLAHELGHVLGFGHLCAGRSCVRAGGRPRPCALMFPSAHPCQDPMALADVVAALYPAQSRVAAPADAPHPLTVSAPPATVPSVPAR